MQIRSYEELAQCIAEMTPEQRQKPVMLINSETGVFEEATTLDLASVWMEPAPENQFIVD